MVGHSQIVQRKIADGGGLGDQQIKSVASGVCWDIDVLGEVETVKKIKEFSYRVGRGVVNMNIKITEYDDIPWGCIECGEEVKYLRDESWVWFRWLLNQECSYQQGTESVGNG